MTRIFNFGSLNIDRVYRVSDFVRPGETIAAREYGVFCGGKGLNQSVAAARAGAVVFHIGKLGPDGKELADMLIDSGVDCSFVRYDGSVTGHAIISVSDSGQNSIIIHGGANRELHEDEILDALAEVRPGDIVLLQNEISGLMLIMEEAKKRGARIALNPSPIDSMLLEKAPINLADFLILNEIEAKALGGEDAPALSRKYPDTAIVLTLGERGSVYRLHDTEVLQPAYRVEAVDTTAAGDTFTGYFLAEIARSNDARRALGLASKAAAVAVSREGAAPSVPWLKELEEIRLEIC